MIPKKVTIFTIIDKDKLNIITHLTVKNFILKKSQSKRNIRVSSVFSRTASTNLCGTIPMKGVSSGTKDSIAGKIARTDPDILVIIASNYLIETLIDIAALLKKRRSNTEMIIGGNRLYDYYSESDNTQKRKFQKYIDFIVNDNREQTYYEIIENLLTGNSNYKSISGLVYKTKGLFIKNVSRISTDLSEIPSPYLYKPVTHALVSTVAAVENSRGCPYFCTYCPFSSANSHRVFYFPVKKVLQEIEYLIHTKTKHIVILDENFNINKNRAVIILNKLYDYRNKPVQFYLFLNISRQLIDDELLGLLAKANVTVTVGIESLNPKTLEAANRQTDLSIINANIKRFDTLRIKYHMEFIIGLPYETEHSLISSIDWIFRTNALKVSFYTLKIEPGTYLEKHYTSFGIIKAKSYPHTVISTDTLSRRQFMNMSYLMSAGCTAFNNAYVRKTVHQCALLSGRKISDILLHYISWSNLTYNTGYHIRNKHRPTRVFKNKPLLDALFMKIRPFMPRNSE